MGVADTESTEIQRFELLRNELIELEKRVQKGSDRSDSEEVILTVSTLLYFTHVTVILFPYEFPFSSPFSCFFPHYSHK